MAARTMCPAWWCPPLVGVVNYYTGYVLPPTPTGSLLLVRVSRNLGISTTILEPASEPVWGGRRVVAVLTHIGRGGQYTGGHWRAYVREGEVWWRVDSLPAGGEIPVQENPFLAQGGHKIELLAFM